LNHLPIEYDWQQATPEVADLHAPPLTSSAMRYRQPTLSTCVSLSPTWSAISYSLVAVMAIIIATGCRPVALTEQLEARRLAADMHVQFTKATEAANRAVMADTDEASASAAREARDGAQS